MLFLYSLSNSPAKKVIPKIINFLLSTIFSVESVKWEMLADSISFHDGKSKPWIIFHEI